MDQLTENVNEIYSLSGWESSGRGLWCGSILVLSMKLNAGKSIYGMFLCSSENEVGRVYDEWHWTLERWSRWFFQQIDRMNNIASDIHIAIDVVVNEGK